MSSNTDPPTMEQDGSTQSSVDTGNASPSSSGETQVNESSEGLNKPKICNCDCLPFCNCECNCEHHCYCEGQCNGTCADRQGRNLIISIDGTSNTICTKNTNVVELHSHIAETTRENGAGVEQLKCYLSGLGTTLPPYQLSVSHWRATIGNVVDLAFAWRFSGIVQDAYRWLVDNYQPGDRIFLFGFSRGAYQIRTLAGMINTLGILKDKNFALIPHVYDFYLNSYPDLPASTEIPKDTTQAKDVFKKETNDIAETFKDTFSHEVKVHFIGAWDTVASIGILCRAPLPLTNTAKHVCFFRHALALDECRAKFLPECLEDKANAKANVNASSTAPVEPDKRHQSIKDSGDHKPLPNVKEVWFAGSHCDIGGGNKENVKLNSSIVPLLWMEHEAQAAGLKFAPGFPKNWNPDAKLEDPVDSMSIFWRILEYLPIAAWDPTGVVAFPSDCLFVVSSRFGWYRLLRDGVLIHAPSFLKRIWNPLGDRSQSRYSTIAGKTIAPHRGRGRVIGEGQLVHPSVILQPNYLPKAHFTDQFQLDVEFSTPAVIKGLTTTSKFN